MHLWVGFSLSHWSRGSFGIALGLCGRAGCGQRPKNISAQLIASFFFSQLCALMFSGISSCPGSNCSALDLHPETWTPGRLAFPSSSAALTSHLREWSMNFENPEVFFSHGWTAVVVTWPKLCLAFVYICIYYVSHCVRPFVHL